MKKKIVALSLVVAMVVMNNVVALGEVGTNWDGTEFDTPDGNKKNVSVDFTVTDTPRYSVDITWGDLQYTYGATGTWDPSEHSYSWSETGGGWAVKSSTSNVINVENHSNREVYGKYSFAVNEEFENTYKPKNLTAIFTNVDDSDGSTHIGVNNKFILPTAVGVPKNDISLKSNVNVNMDGELGKTISGTKTVGIVTITLSNQDNIS